MANISGHNYAEDLLNDSSLKSTASKTSVTGYDYANDILSGQSETLSGNMTVTGRPSIKNNPEMAANTGDLATASFADDPAVRINYLAQQRFPNDPNAINRYGFDEQAGQIYYEADDGNLYSEDSPEGGVGSFLKRNLASVASKAIPLAAQTGAGIATSPMMLTGLGTVGSVGVVTAAGGVGESIRQFLGKRMLGDKFSMGEVGKEAVLGGLGQLGGKLLIRSGNRNLARDFDRMDTPRVNQLLSDANTSGIQLTPAEATGLRSLRNQQRMIGRTPEGADIMGDFYAARNTEQIPKARDAMLDSISPVTETDLAASRLKDAASEIGDKAIKARSDKVRPIYQKLMQPTNIVDTSAFADDAVFNSVLANVRKDPIFGGLKNAPDNSLPVLDAVKKEMDDMIGQATQSGQRNRARVLSESRDNLLQAADSAYPEYGQVRAEFAGMSPEVTQITKGSIGNVAKSEGQVKDTAKLFDFNKISPAQVKQTRLQFEKNGKLDEYNAGLRAFIQDKWAQAGKDTAAGAKGNLAGAYRASIFGDVRARETLKAAMQPDQYDAFSRFMNVLEAAGKAMPEGSPTATDLTAMKGLKDKAGGIAKTIANFDITKPLGAIGDWIENTSASKQAEKIATIITSPDGISKMRELRKLSPTSEKARVLVSQLLTNEVSKTNKRVFGYDAVSKEDIKALSYLNNSGTSLQGDE